MKPRPPSRLAYEEGGASDEAECRCCSSLTSLCSLNTIAIQIAIQIEIETQTVAIAIVFSLPSSVLPPKPSTAPALTEITYPTRTVGSHSFTSMRKSRITPIGPIRANTGPSERGGHRGPANANSAPTESVGSHFCNSHRLTVCRSTLRHELS